MLETLNRWDRELFIYLNNLGSDNFDSFWVFVTQIDSWIFLFFFFFIVIIKYYKTKKGIWVSVFTLLTFGISYGLKYLTKSAVQRLRPNNVPELAELIRVLQNPIDYSFFSGHASVSFAVTTFVVLSLHRFTKWVYLFYIWPLLFSVSRIYVGVHYPSDIFIGTCIGFMVGFGMFYLIKKFKII